MPLLHKYVIAGTFCYQEHEEKRDKQLGVPYDIDNQVTEIATSPGVKSPTSTPYGAIANGEPKPPSPDGKSFCLNIMKCLVVSKMK